MPINAFPAYHVTGAIYHWVRVKGDANFYFLGTAEVTPQMQVRRYRQDVPNDEHGKSLPGQRTRDGQAAKVAVILSRWSKWTWEKIQTSAAAVGLDFLDGSEGRWSRGGLVFGQEDFELWQVYDNALNPFGPNRATYGIELGRYWPSVMFDEDNQPQAGTQVERKMFVFDCQPKRVPQASVSVVNDAANERGWVLYSVQDAAFPADVLVPQ